MALGLGTGGELDLDRLAREVAAVAKQHDLTVVPVLPAVTGASLLVTLSAATTAGDWFVRTAAAAGSRLLYARRRTFAVDQVAEFAALPEAESDDEGTLETAWAAVLRPLRDSARQYEGTTCELAVAFVAAGVLHRWTARAAWYERLQTAIRQAAAQPGTRPEPGGGVRAPSANSGRSWSAEEQARLAARFAEDADLRALAAELGRTPGAVRARLRRLGLMDGD